MNVNSVTGALIYECIDCTLLLKVNLQLHCSLQKHFDTRHEAGDLRKIGAGHHLGVEAEPVRIVAHLDELNQLVQRVQRVRCQLKRNG